MRYGDLSYTQIIKLADDWRNMNKDERKRTAKELGSTVQYIGRQLRTIRFIEAKREAHERAMGTVKPIKPMIISPPPTPPTQNKIENDGTKLRACVFDLECTDFGTEGYSGYLLCVSVLPLDTGEVYTHRIRYNEHSDDRRLLKEVLTDLAQYDILIGHNIAAFDLNWLHSRWMFHDKRGADVGNWPRRWLYVDTYQAAKGAAIKTRKSLGNLIDYFGIEGEKTAIYRTSWNQVRSPYETDFNMALNDIIYHCEQDVIANRGVFNCLWLDALARNANPLKMCKWGFVAGGMLTEQLEAAQAELLPLVAR